MLRLLSIACCTLLSLPGLAMESPLPVSPANPDGIAVVASPCPTFSWTAVPGARGYELVVYGIVDGGPAGDAILREVVPAGATVWVPSAERCLGSDGTYAWMIRVLGDTEDGEWSEANLFEVSSRPGPGDVKEALEVLRRHLDAEGEGADLLRRLVRPSAISSAPAAETGGPPSASSSSVPGSALALGSDGASHLLGTTGEVALDLQVAGTRALRLEPAKSSLSGAVRPNLVGGSSVNEVMSGVFGATIGGGGGDFADIGLAPLPMPNVVTGHFNTVGGGWGNTAGDEDGNPHTGRLSTVGGGEDNLASGSGSTVSGGFRNSATGGLSTVGGGVDNLASGGGSTVPGGGSNIAAGFRSLAAGSQARANHGGTFVWADSCCISSFESTGINQFLVRAAGGVGIGTSSPDAPLDILGGNWDLATSEGDVKIGDDTYRLKIGVAIGGGGAGDVRIHSHGGTERILLGSGGTNVLAVAASDGVYPDADDLYRLGISTRRWKEVWAANGVIQTSDLRLKSGIEDLTYGLAEVLRLRPVTFRWRDQPGGEVHLGVLAQEIGEVVPEVVVDPEGPEGFLGVNYAELIPLLIAAVQEQQELIERLRIEIEGLQSTEATP